MKRLLYAAALAIFSFILTGCPYETEVPIDKPSINFLQICMANGNQKVQAMS